MSISPESSARFKAFRHLVHHCSEQLSSTETHALVYIWLHTELESYKNSAAIRVLSKLESNGHFSPHRPEGLLEMLKELKRTDLCNEVRDFMKTKWPKVVKKESKKWTCNDEDLQATFEVVLAQTTVLMQQIEAFEKVLLFGRDARGRAKDIITGAAQTAKTLADRLKRAENELYHKENSTENDQYVDLTSLIAPQGGLTASVQSVQPVARTLPLELAEYVDMTAVKATLKPHTKRKQNNKKESYGNSTNLASYYTDSHTPAKTHTTISLSTAVGTASPTAEFETQPNMAHTSSTESTVPSSSNESSPRHTQSSSDIEASSPEHGAVYCNIQELKTKVLKSLSNPSASVTTSLTSPEMVMPPSVQEDAVYSNLSESTPRDIPLPPRDIQRALNASMPPPVDKQQGHSPLASGETLEGMLSPTRVGCVQENKEDSASSQQDAVVSPSVTLRPVTAPKPRIKQKPDIPPRRSSLSHISHMRVGSGGSLRSLKCVSVMGSMKNAVTHRSEQPDIPSDLSDSYTEDDTYMDMASQRIVPPRAGQGEHYYHTQLHSTAIKQNDSDRAYLVVQHHN